MKKILCFLFLLAGSVFYGQNLTVNGSEGTVNLNYCNSTSVDVNFYVFADIPAYNITLMRNGSVYSIITKTYNEAGFKTENLFQSSANTLPAGQYQCIINNSGITNIVNVVNPNPFAKDTYLQCSGDENNFADHPRCTDDIQVYEFVPEVLLVVFKGEGLIYKVKKTGGSALDMFNVHNNPQYEFSVYGYQNFDEPITGIDYTSDGKLLVGFSDGKILKVNGLGGTGQNMFAVNESNNDFSNVDPSLYPYYAGHYRFNSGVSEIKHINGKTFVCLNSGKVLKVHGSGGTGANLFAVEETTNGFSGISGYNYYAGHAKFNSRVLKIFSNNSHTFFAFSNGKLLKINNVGGTGANMFALEETTNGFNGFSGYNYYVGHHLFNGVVTQMEFQANVTTLGFSNGKLLKINGIGGSGANLFALQETTDGFAGFSGYNYYLGHTKYSSGVKKIITVPSGVSTFITFENGKLMKVDNVGGTGANMYNATENSSGFTTSSSSYTAYLVGSSEFGATVTDIDYIPSTKELLLSFSNHKMFKASMYGGSGDNCFNAAQTENGFYPLYGYTNYIKGTQLWPCEKSKIIVEGKKETEKTTVEENNNLKIYPNPTNGIMNIALGVNSKGFLEVYTFDGKKVYEKEINNENDIKVDLSKNAAGIYFVKINIGNEMITKKIIKQ